MAVEAAPLLLRMGEHIRRFSMVADTPAVSRGSWAAFTQRAEADHNAALVSGPDAIDDLHTLLGALEQRSALFYVPHDEAELRYALAWEGMTLMGTAPLMVRALDATFAPDPHTRRVRDGRSLDAVGDLLCAAFRTDQAGLDPSLPRRDDVHAWLLEEGRGPASTVITTPDPDLVGVFCMGTDPIRVGRGLGRRVLAHALAHHAAQGVAEAYLVSTPEGERLYRTLGFRTVTELDLWVTP